MKANFSLVLNNPEILKVEGREGEIHSTINRFEWQGYDSDGLILEYLYKKNDSVTWESTTSTSYIWTDFDLGSDNYFYVKAVDDDGLISDVLVWQFKFINQEPEIITLVPGPKEVLNKKDVLFFWNVEDPEEDMLKYSLFLGKYENDLNLIIENSDETSIVIEELIYGETYFWKLIINDGYCEVSSDVRSFSLNNLPNIKSDSADIVNVNSNFTINVQSQYFEEIYGFEFDICFNDQYITYDKEKSIDEIIQVSTKFSEFLKITKKMDETTFKVSLVNDETLVLSDKEFLLSIELLTRDISSETKIDFRNASIINEQGQKVNVDTYSKLITIEE